jgi:hypothetical protein
VSRDLVWVYSSTALAGEERADEKRSEEIRRDD